MKVAEDQRATYKHDNRKGCNAFYSRLNNPTFVPVPDDRPHCRMFQEPLVQSGGASGKAQGGKKQKRRCGQQRKEESKKCKNHAYASGNVVEQLPHSRDSTRVIANLAGIGASSS